MLTLGIINNTLVEARKSKYKFKVGCTIFKGKKIISSGHNAIRSNAVPSKYKVWGNSIHAEQDAIFSCNVPWYKLKGCSVLIIKISKTEELLSNASPCKMCLKLLNFVGINKIFYSNDKGEIVKL